MRILLIGASGLLGHNVIQQLLHDHHEVVAVVRNKANMQIQESNLHLIEDNLTLEVLVKAANQCDGIINCAGTTNMALLHLENYMPINRDLCRLLITAMEKNHIHRLVHVSTANTIGYGSLSTPTDEQSPIKEPFSSSWYALSKQEGEEIIKQAANAHPDWHMIIVNPGFMIGAYDTKPSSGTLLLAGYRKRIMLTPKGGKSFISVTDAARAVVNALTMGVHGDRYLLTNQSMTLKEFYHLQSCTMNYQQHIIEIPNWLVKSIGKVGDLLRSLHIKTQVATRNTNQLLITEYYTNQKAREELKMPQTPIEQAILDFHTWHTNKNVYQ